MKHFVFPAVSAAVLFLAMAVYGSDTLEILSNAAFENPVMAEVPFPHDSHNERAQIDDCSVCHHVWENGELSTESSEGTPCADCHDPSLHRRGLNLSAAYHGLCKDCHIKEGRGPIVCGECHRKR